MSGTTGDVLTQARTPTDAAIRAALKAPVQLGSPIHSMTGALLAAYTVDAPRILALAYREAATLAETQADEKHAWIRKQSGFYVQYSDGGMTAQTIHTLRRFASELRALATAQEEGR